MRTECSRTYRHGFMLKESDLRIMLSCMVEQISRSSGYETHSVAFELRFRNGAIAEPESLDEILALENYGSEQIVRLKTSVSSDAAPENASVSLTYTDADRDEDSWDAISYKVVSNDRDWAFVTSSRIEERIAKTKSFGGNLRAIPDARVMLRTLPLVVMMLMYAYIAYDWSPRVTTMLRADLDSLREEWMAGELTDPIEADLRIAAVQAATTQIVDPASRRWFIAAVFLVGLMQFSPRLLSLAFPSYNFVWGEYARVYARRRTAVRWVFGTLIGGIALAVLGNWVSVLVGIK